MKQYRKLDFDGSEPKYIQIAHYFKKMIDNKEIKDGEKLPTIRALSQKFEVNNVTIVSAYKKLKSDGYAYQKIGSGTFAKRKEVTSTFRKVYSNILKKVANEQISNVIDFTGETCNEILFPIEDLKEIINDVLERDGANALVTKHRYGYKKLISTINKVFWKNKLKEEDILIVSGAQQGIDIAAKSILNINDNVAVEKPTYMGAICAFKWRKANIFEIPVNEDGIDIEKFEKILQKNDIKCFYAMSYFQNPTGISYTISKKKKILELAKIYNFYILEDDYLSELIYTENIEYMPFKWLDTDNRVIYIKSFSKIFLPGIRLGYLVAPSKFREIIENSKLNSDITTSSLMQRALERYIDSGKWKENIYSLNNEYKKRYKVMKNILDRDFNGLLEYIDPEGGLTFYLKINNKIISAKKLFEKLMKKRIIITPAQIFFISPCDGKYEFRMGFYQCNEEQIEYGMMILKEILENIS